MTKKSCQCPTGFPIQTKYVKEEAPLNRLIGVVIRHHSGECPCVDEIVRFGQ